MWGVSGALYLQSAIAEQNIALGFACGRLTYNLGALITRSYATVSCEPCQDRDVAALSNVAVCHKETLQ